MGYVILIWRKMKKLGFIIANENEEFLAEFEDTTEYTSVGWSIVLDLAKVYSNPEEAGCVARKVKTPYKKWVCLLSENKSQLIVTVAGDDVPPWIEKHH